MGAKAKLNTAYFHGAVVVAGVLGWMAGSWMVFLIALGVLLVANVFAGDIRR
jgi:hypothetical protein